MPSQIMQIENTAMAFDFNLACTLRLLYYDSDQQNQTAEILSGCFQNTVSGQSQPTKQQPTEPEYW